MTKPNLIDAIASNDRDTNLWKTRFAAAKGAYDSGEFRQCETLLFRLIEQGKTLKASMFAVNSCHLGLGAVYLATGKMELAKEHLDQAINATAGSDDPALRELCAAARRFYAEVLTDAGDQSGAEEQLQNAIQTLEQLGADCAVPLAYALSDLSALYVTQDKLKEAKDLIIAAMGLLEHTVGSEDPEYARAHLICNICDSKPEEKLDAVEDAIQRLHYYFNRKHPSITRAVRWYLKKRQERGETDKIEELKETLDLHLKAWQA